jgi:hypothetical protein
MWNTTGAVRRSSGARVLAATSELDRADRTNSRWTRRPARNTGIFIAVSLVALITVIGRHWLDWHSRDAESPPVAEPVAVGSV